jgi:hypothetical protein
LDRFDIGEIATALQGQNDYDHYRLVDPRTGEMEFWTRDGGIDGENPIDLDELDLIPISPLPSYVWYQDMADFAESISDERAGQRLARVIRGKGAFRHFKDELREEHPELFPAWYEFSNIRAQRRAVTWLADNELVDQDDADRFVAEHADPVLP